MNGFFETGDNLLFDLNGQRKYLTRAEAKRLMQAARKADSRTALFARVLYYTGCRCSEALQVTPRRLDFECGRIIFRTLKRRKTVYRAVPVPRHLLRDLCAFAEASGLGPDDRLFSWCRQTAWRRIHALCDRAGIAGPQATVKGFRHQWGCHAINCGLPESLVGRVLGHSDSRSTRVYTFVVNLEERDLVARMWGGLADTHRGNRRN